MQSRNIRWNRVLIVVAGALGLSLVCCVGVWALAPNLRYILSAPFWKTDPQLAAQAAHKFVDYDLPSNYQELKVLSISINDNNAAVVIAHRERPGDMIQMEVLTQGIIGVDAWEVSCAKRLSGEVGHVRYSTQLVGAQKTTVRGQPTTLRLFEGSDEQGRRIRQVVCGFKGKQGDMLLAIVAGQDTWDQSMVDHFLQSLR